MWTKIRGQMVKFPVALGVFVSPVVILSAHSPSQHPLLMGQSLHLKTGAESQPKTRSGQFACKQPSNSPHYQPPYGFG